MAQEVKRYLAERLPRSQPFLELEFSRYFSHYPYLIRGSSHA